jgi:hypothetical protein
VRESDYVCLCEGKSSEQHALWMFCAGNGEAVDPLILKRVCGELVCDGPPQLAILHRHLNKWCPLFSLCDVMSVGKDKIICVCGVGENGCTV